MIRVAASPLSMGNGPGHKHSQYPTHAMPKGNNVDVFVQRSPPIGTDHQGVDHHPPAALLPRLLAIRGSCGGALTGGLHQAAACCVTDRAATTISATDQSEDRGRRGVWRCGGFGASGDRPQPGRGQAAAVRLQWIASRHHKEPPVAQHQGCETGGLACNQCGWRRVTHPVGVVAVSQGSISHQSSIRPNSARP